MNAQQERIVVSVGGSLMVPDAIDTEFLTRFKRLVLDKVGQGLTFSIIAGGGRTARAYQEAAQAVTPLSREDLDWLGIHATRLNAQLLRNIFVEQAQTHIIKNPTVDIDGDAPILIAAGWQPGCSTDYVATLVAKNLGARRLANLTNTDYVYSADPKKEPDATPLKKLDWSAFRALIPATWDPGLSTPFDPVAAQEAEVLNLEVAIMNGTKLEEFEHYLDGEPFTGTVIA